MWVRWNWLQLPEEKRRRCVEFLILNFIPGEENYLKGLIEAGGDRWFAKLDLFEFEGYKQILRRIIKDKDLPRIVAEKEGSMWEAEEPKWENFAFAALEEAADAIVVWPTGNAWRKESHA